MLQNREELQILEKEIADLKKKVKKLKDENDKLRKVLRRKSRQ
jgi:cell division protein FtsB